MLMLVASGQGLIVVFGGNVALTYWNCGSYTALSSELPPTLNAGATPVLASTFFSTVCVYLLGCSSVPVQSGQRSSSMLNAANVGSRRVPFEPALGTVTLTAAQRVAAKAARAKTERVIRAMSMV